MLKESETLIGLKFVGNYVVTKLIAEGTFSRIYLTEDEETQDLVAIKVAKEMNRTHEPTSPFATRCYNVVEGSVVEVHPSTLEVVREQQSAIGYSPSDCFISIGHYEERHGFPMYHMEFITLPTLRTLLIEGSPISVSLLSYICKKLEKIGVSIVQYHGDLKPEHIFVEDNYSAFISPGRFDPLNCEEGRELDCAVTTAIYYPLMKPDDSLAFGIMLWEIACKQHPLLMPHDAGSTAIGDSVRAWAKRYENVGQYFLSPLRNIRRPAELVPGMPPHLEQVLLKGMRLQVGVNGLIETGPGFESFSEWQDALQNLIDLGITHL